MPWTLSHPAARVGWWTIPAACGRWKAATASGWRRWESPTGWAGVRPRFVHLHGLVGRFVQVAEQYAAKGFRVITIAQGPSLDNLVLLGTAQRWPGLTHVKGLLTTACTVRWNGCGLFQAWWPLRTRPGPASSTLCAGGRHRAESSAFALSRLCLSLPPSPGSALQGSHCHVGEQRCGGLHDHRRHESHGRGYRSQFGLF